MDSGFSIVLLRFPMGNQRERGTNPAACTDHIVLLKQSEVRLSPLAQLWRPLGLQNVTHVSSAPEQRERQVGHWGLRTGGASRGLCVVDRSAIGGCVFACCPFAKLQLASIGQRLGVGPRVVLLRNAQLHWSSTKLIRALMACLSFCIAACEGKRGATAELSLG